MNACRRTDRISHESVRRKIRQKQTWSNIGAIPAILLAGFAIYMMAHYSDPLTWILGIFIIFAVLGGLR